MSDRASDRIRGSKSTTNADESRDGRYAIDDASAAAADETELSSDQLDGVAGGAVKEFSDVEDAQYRGGGLAEQ